ncbi:MAG: FAD-binding oxidoreductase [Actinomycetota bacterium]|nr:FAD-binding oxidoreductase [Candidatus Dormibacteraeota bacterium]MDQ6945572.1 FAD-binding oxidoreductase [Actinomycetota bacterium]
MNQTAGAVVVGAGIIGTSTAFNLARLGVADVLLLDREGVAAQASRLSAGLVRTHYSNAPEARLALRGLHWFEHWSELVGGDPGFHQTGLANPVAREDHDKLRRNVAMLQALGVETQLVGPEELVELEPDMRVDEDQLAAYEPRSGYANPGGTTRAMADAARRLGVDLREGVTVTAVRTEGGRVSGVETSAGFISSPVVVLANGAWSVPLAAALGIEIPIQTVAVRLAFVKRPSGMRPGWGRHLVVLDRAHGAYTRPDGEDLSMIGLAGARVPIESADDYERLAPPDSLFEELALAQVARRFPSFAGAPVIRRHSGPIDATPDLCAIIDRVQPEGLHLAVGMSGSGFKKGPAIGEAVAELVVHGEARTVPVHEFRLSRFAENDEIQGEGYLIAPESTAVLGPANLVH